MFVRYCSIRKLIVTVTADTCQYIIVVCRNGGVEHEKRHCRTRSYRGCPAVCHTADVFFLYTYIYFFIIIILVIIIIVIILCFSCLLERLLHDTTGGGGRVFALGRCVRRGSLGPAANDPNFRSEQTNRVPNIVCYIVPNKILCRIVIAETMLLNKTRARNIVTAST